MCAFDAHLAAAPGRTLTEQGRTGAAGLNLPGIFPGNIFRKCSPASLLRSGYGRIPSHGRALFAGLVTYRAGCLAGRLTGRLALAAAAFFHRFFQIFRRQGLNSFHNKCPFCGISSSFLLDKYLLS